MEIKFFKNRKKFRKGELGVKPDLYWKYILSATSLLILLSCVFGLYLFWEINRESSPAAVNSVEIESLDEEDIDRAQEFFKKREDKSLEIINSPSSIVDPSL
jgi:hypothetical protein